MRSSILVPLLAITLLAALGGSFIAQSMISDEVETFDLKSLAQKYRTSEVRKYNEQEIKKAIGIR